MAEIRVRDASPQLIKAFQAIAMELKEATITGAITKMIPRYLDMQKRIIEQNKELSELSAELRRYQFKESTMKEQFTDLVGLLDRQLREAKKVDQQFGTKKSTRKPAPGAKAKKLSTNKKRK